MKTRDYQLGSRLIGSGTWLCDGCELTPQLRQDILETFAEQYNRWKGGGFSYNWTQCKECERREQCEGRGQGPCLLYTEQNVLKTVDDYLDESNAETKVYDCLRPISIGDEFFAWVKEYLEELWAERVLDDDADPVYGAICQIEWWLTKLSLDDIVRWYDEVTTVGREEEAAGASCTK